ncbi:VWA domain-containing protein [Microbacterium karelineae]|uniref:VWA domain-containing protein n=1 Tax=Microbacterium karelineae TaxID=2654283 RepID=UPI0012EA4203|nr:VWA domain-containing protein [Microbacterium karelineae]
MSVLPILHPAALALIVLPVLGIAAWALVRAHGAASRASWGLRIALVLACGLLALRPGIPDGAARTVATDVDVFLVVDSTTSITAEDWGDGEPRLAGVRADVRRIVDAYPGARFSLITFDNQASQRLPLTTDTAAVESALEVLRPPTTLYARGSSIGQAAPLLAEALRGTAASAAAEDRSRLVFYFGDGEQTASADPESFSPAAEWADGGAVFGYGTADGGPMRTVSGGVGADEAYIQHEGARALSMIDEENLEAIAGDLGVTYAHRTAGAEPVLPEAPTTSMSVTSGETLGARTEVSWVVALVVAALLAGELALGAARLRRSVRDTRPRKEAA